MRLVEGPAGPLAVTVTPGDPALEPVCFIHPVNTAGAVWAPLADRLDPPRRCALPDLRGHGGSVRAGPFTAEAYADDVVAVLDALGWERAHLVGASLGGPVAVVLAATVPDRVLSISAFGSALALHLDDEQLAAVRTLLERDGVRAFAAQLGPAALGQAYQAALGPAVVDLIAGIDRPAEMVYEITATAFTSDVSHLAGAVAAPALVGNGDEDGSCTPDAGKVMGAALSAGTVVTFAGVGHLPMLEVPDEVAALLDHHFRTAEDRLTIHER